MINIQKMRAGKHFEDSDMCSNLEQKNIESLIKYIHPRKLEHLKGKG